MVSVMSVTCQSKVLTASNEVSYEVISTSRGQDSARRRYTYNSSVD